MSLCGRGQALTLSPGQVLFVKVTDLNTFKYQMLHIFNI